MDERKEKRREKQSIGRLERKKGSMKVSWKSRTDSLVWKTMSSHLKRCIISNNLTSEDPPRTPSPTVCWCVSLFYSCFWAQSGSMAVSLMTHNSVWPVVSCQVVNGPPSHSTIRYTHTQMHKHKYTSKWTKTCNELQAHTKWKCTSQDISPLIDANTHWTKTRCSGTSWITHIHVHPHKLAHIQVHANSCVQHAEAVWKPLPLSGSNTFYSFTVGSNRQALSLHTHALLVRSCVCVRVQKCMRDGEKQKTCFPMFASNVCAFSRDI